MKRIALAWMVALILFPSLSFANNPYKTYGAYECQKRAYDCVVIKRGQTWQSLFPDDKERDWVRRLNRMNTKLYKGLIIAVPITFHFLELNDLGPFERYIMPPGRDTIIFSTQDLAWAAYSSDGRLIRWGPASGGMDYCKDVKRRCRTTVGEYSITRKKGARCKSRKYPLGKGGAPMPFCMFFYRGFAFHGSPSVPGHHASHGCVRLFVEDARWLNEEFITLPSQGKPTKVIVEPYL